MMGQKPQYEMAAHRNKASSPLLFPFLMSDEFSQVSAPPSTYLFLSAVHGIAE